MKKKLIAIITTGVLLLPTMVLAENHEKTVPGHKNYLQEKSHLWLKKNNGDFERLTNEEARAVNPLNDVNQETRRLITKKAWVQYNAFMAKQYPAHYEEISEGYFVPNKMYYVTRLERLVKAYEDEEFWELRRKREWENQAILDRWEGKEPEEYLENESLQKQRDFLDQIIDDFNRAPGITPYVVGLNGRDVDCEKYGVSEPDQEYWNSKWNSALVKEHGKFENNKWEDNPFIKENNLESDIVNARIKFSHLFMFDR